MPLSYRKRISIPSSEGSYERFLSSDAFIRQGLRGDNAESASLLVVTWTAILADSPVDSSKPNRVINQFVSKLTNDLTGIIATFSGLAHELTRSVELDSEGAIRIISDLFVEFRGTPIFREYHEFYKTRDPRLFRYLLTFLLFGKKLYKEDPELDTTALRGWLEVEDRLAGLVLPPWIENLRDVMRFVFETWSVDCFLPKHGGGAVAERGVRGVNAKNVAFSLPEGIRRLYVQDSLFLPNETGLSSLPDPVGVVRKAKLHASRLKFVPKDWKKTRSICMEPIPYQWAQQGVRLWYEDYLKSSVLGNHIFIEDQGINQRAARFGSMTGWADTIDLSSASDSVAWDLVKSIFPAKVLKHLYATRTRVVTLPDGSDVPVRKFAPMGSALCFPVQSTIYATIALMVGMAQRFGIDWREPGVFKGMTSEQFWAAYKLSFSDKLVVPKEGDHRFLPFYAYGDDIITDKRMTSSVVEALTQLAFRVNTEKSFTGHSAFRESCGIYCLGGVDVTPFIFKTKKVSRRMSIVDMDSVIQLANRAYVLGYSQARRHLIQFVLHTPIKGVNRVKGGKNPILFTTDEEESFAILTDVPRFDHLKTRKWDPKSSDEGTHNSLQRSEALSISVGPRKKRQLSEEFDNYRYTTWWRSKYHRSGTGVIDAVPMTADTLEVGIRWRWTAI